MLLSLCTEKCCLASPSLTPRLLSVSESVIRLHSLRVDVQCERGVGLDHLIGIPAICRCIIKFWGGFSAYDPHQLLSLSFLPAGFQAVLRSLHNDHLEISATLLDKPARWTTQRPSWLNSGRINETLPPLPPAPVHICSQALIRSGRGHSLESVGWLPTIDMLPSSRHRAGATWSPESDATTPIVNHNGEISAAISVFDLL